MTADFSRLFCRFCPLATAAATGQFLAEYLWTVSQSATVTKGRQQRGGGGGVREGFASGATLAVRLTIGWCVSDLIMSRTGSMFSATVEKRTNMFSVSDNMNQVSEAQGSCFGPASRLSKTEHQ